MPDTEDKDESAALHQGMHCLSNNDFNKILFVLARMSEKVFRMFLVMQSLYDRLISQIGYLK